MLDGKITSNGGNAVVNNAASSGGAGGSVVLATTAISGVGKVEVCILIYFVNYHLFISHILHRLMVESDIAGPNIQ